MAHRALNGKQITRPWQHRSIQRRNPNALDVAGSALNLAIIGGLAFVGYKLATGPLCPALKQIGIQMGDCAGGTSGASGGAPPNPPGAPDQCHPWRAGNTQLLFTVTSPRPWAPGTVVIGNGSLNAVMSGGSWGGSIGGATIELWEPGQCDGPFDWAQTDASGNFTWQRVVQLNEAGGYYVYARYPGGSNLMNAYDSAQTGTWFAGPQ